MNKGFEALLLEFDEKVSNDVDLLLETYFSFLSRIS